MHTVFTESKMKNGIQQDYMGHLRIIQPSSVEDPGTKDIIPD